MPRLPPTTLSLFLLTLASADAIVFRSYDATRHKRFDPFPTNPQINPNQIFANLDLTGIGMNAISADIQCALVSRQHVLFATHFTPGGLGPGGAVRFVDSGGTYHIRNITSQVVIQDGGQNSDLSVLKLTSPIDAGSGVEPLAYLDLPSPGDYETLVIGVAGKRDEGGGNKFPVIGKGVIADVETSSRTENYGGNTGFLTTRYMHFDYVRTGGGLDPDDVHFEGGDSGSPTFVDHNGRAALVGVHSYVTGYFADPQPPPSEPYENYDVFIPHYITALDAVLATDGYRMRPANAPMTTLGDASATAQTTPRRALPLDFSYTLTNTGANETGNLEVEFHFDPAEAPDSLTPPAGWVTYGGAPSWTFRRALLAAAAGGTFTATWTAAPSVATIDPGIMRRSDTTTEASPGFTIALAPSFADWASGLSEPAESDDPDKDQLINLLEYAFGGDPENGHLVFADGGPLTPALSVGGGTVTLSFPERDDKVLRGLSYIPEFSSTLGGWVTTTPPGFSSTTEAYAPAVPGFVKRVLTWTAAPDAGFARIRVELNE
ncbi:trypsin-like serine peptidase [Haloferula sp. A504]|uniref:trypsin-like serine peptidase n=1 Tax=Haloferula sp. A504 TaxID=3373601 RepID=UPI0031C7F1C4|nr:S1 family peptidase [Verrucomicrobiaceae bacterium E54]